MATAVQSQTTSYHFDDRNIQWRELGDFKHMMASIFFVDEEKNIVDFIIKFDPNEKVLLHRHLAATNTFVVEGEHRIYEPDGQLREVRPVGQYTFSTGGDAHNEGSRTCSFGSNLMTKSTIFISSSTKKMEATRCLKSPSARH